MNKFRIKTKPQEYKCQWKFRRKQNKCECLQDIQSGAIINGKFYCECHVDIFMMVNNQFNILEEIGEQENENN